jgi:hypothetical protein
MSDTTVTQPGIAGAVPEAPQQPAGTLTQEQFNAALAAERRKWKTDQEAATAKAQRDAEEAAKAKQGEFQSLAEQRAARIAELEATEAGKAERLTALETEIKQQTDARLKALPKEIAEMKPETDDPLIVYRWLARAEQAAAKLTGQQPPRNPGTPPGPRGGGVNPTAGAGGDTVAAKRASGDYTM